MIVEKCNKYTIALVVSIGLFACGEVVTSNVSVNDQYQLPWKSPERELIQIGKTLVRSKITGCGELYVRKSKTSDSEYLVACTRNTTEWRFYVVKTNDNTVNGPLTDKIPSPY